DLSHSEPVAVFAGVHVDQGKPLHEIWRKLPEDRIQYQWSGSGSLRFSGLEHSGRLFAGRQPAQSAGRGSGRRYSENLAAEGAWILFPRRLQSAAESHAKCWFAIRTLEQPDGEARPRFDHQKLVHGDRL